MAKKRLVFCTYPSVYSSLVLKRLLADHDIDVVAIISSSRVLNKNYGALRAALKQIQLSGWRYSTYLFFVTDLFAVLSALIPARDKLPSIAKLAKNRHIPLLKTSDINDPGVCQFIHSKKPEFLLAAHFNQLIKPLLLDMPNMTCLNIHPSLLPDYKGVDPVFFALLDKQQHIGVTLHEMAERFDTGKVLSQQSFLLKQYDNVFSHNCRLFSTGAELALTLMKKASIPSGKPQKPGQGCYDSWPGPASIKSLRRKGFYLIKLRDYFNKLGFFK